MNLIIDFEASGLMRGGFPIEVAWIDEDGDAISMLIRPTDTWLSDDMLWSYESGAIHGLSKEVLLEQGQLPERVCDIITSSISDQCVLFSDNPTFDQAWLDRLFNEAGKQHSYHIQDFNSMLEVHHNEDAIQGAYYQAHQISPPNHRAQRDVEYFHRVYRILAKLDTQIS